MVVDLCPCFVVLHMASSFSDYQPSPCPSPRATSVHLSRFRATVTTTPLALHLY